MESQKALTICQNWPAKPMQLYRESTINKYYSARSVYYHVVCTEMIGGPVSFGNRPDELLTLIDPHIKHAIPSSVKQQIIVRIIKYVRSNK